MFKGAWMYNSLQIMVTLKRAQLLRKVKRDHKEKKLQPAKEVTSKHDKSE